MTQDKTQKTKKVYISEDTYLEVDIEIFKNSKNIINIQEDTKITKCKVMFLKDCYIAIPEKLILEE